MRSASKANWAPMSLTTQPEITNLEIQLRAKYNDISRFDVSVNQLFALQVRAHFNQFYKETLGVWKRIEIVLIAKTLLKGGLAKFKNHAEVSGRGASRQVAGYGIKFEKLNLQAKYLKDTRMVQPHHNLNFLLGVTDPTSSFAPYRLNGATHTGLTVSYHTHRPKLPTTDLLVNNVIPLELFVTDLATLAHASQLSPLL